MGAELVHRVRAGGNDWGGFWAPQSTAARDFCCRRRALGLFENLVGAL